MAPKSAADMIDALPSSSEEEESSDEQPVKPASVPKVKNLPQGGAAADDPSQPLLAGAGAPSDASEPLTPRSRAKFKEKSKSTTPRGAADLAAAVPNADQALAAAEEAKAAAGAAMNELGQARMLTAEEQEAMKQAAKEDAERAAAAAKKLLEDIMNDRPPPCWPLADLSPRMMRYINLLFDSLPEETKAKIPPSVEPHLKPGLIKAIQIAGALSGWIAWILRWGYRIWNMLPLNIVQMIIGLALCYFGGTFVMTIAAAEAFRTMGAEKTINDIKVIAHEVGKVFEANDKDDEEDLDGDGKADVDELTPPQLLQRKALLIMATVKEPQKIQQGVASIYAAFLAVVATLRLEFAQTVAMAIGVADMAKKPLVLGIKPNAEKVLPPQTHQWIQPSIESALQLFAILVAMYIQQIISAFYSALRGGRLFSEAVFNILVEKAKRGIIICPGVVGVDYDPENSILDDVIGWILSAQGFWFQLSTGFSVPFPFNILMTPLTMIELLLKAQVVAGAMKDASGGGDGSRMLAEVEEFCLLANCTCPVAGAVQQY